MVTKTKIEASNAPRAQALRALREAIGSGSWSAGDVLPSERVLSTRLSLNRGAVRWALASLDAEGLTQSSGPRTRVVTHGALRMAKGNDPLMSNVVAVISTPLPAMDQLSDEPELRGWLSAVVRGCLHGLALQGLHPLLINPAHFQKPAGFGMDSASPLGILLPEARSEKNAVTEIVAHRNPQVPMVAYGGNPAMAGLDRVVSDHDLGSYMLAQWLVKQGRRRIVEVWPSGAGYWLDARHSGYVRALAEAGMTPENPILCPAFQNHPDSASTFETESRAFAGCLVDRLACANPADAFMVHSDGDVSRVAAACRLCGKEPNRDVLLVGYDNYASAIRSKPFMAGLPLATIDKKNFGAGEAMIRLLMDRIGNKLPPEPQVRIIQPELVLLENT